MLSSRKDSNIFWPLKELLDKYSAGRVADYRNTVDVLGLYSLKDVITSLKASRQQMESVLYIVFDRRI